METQIRTVLILLWLVVCSKHDTLSPTGIVCGFECDDADLMQVH